MVGEIQSCQSWWLMLEVSFEQRVVTVASRGGGQQPHGVIGAAGGQGVPVRTERHTPNGVALLRLAQRARVGRVGEIPRPHGGIDAAKGQGVPVGTERDTNHVVGVAGQGLAQRARVGRVGEIPQPHGAIGAAGGQGVTVGG
jgi:hypothetical protein